MTRRPDAGFTLLELLVVLAVIGLLAAIAVPRVAGVLPGARVDEAARGLAAGLREARSLAVARNREIGFSLDGRAGRYHYGDGGGGALPDGIAITLITGTGEVTGERSGIIRFYPDGSSTGGRIELAIGARQSKVTIDWLTGRVRVDG